jgi:hypothetical protein
VTEFCIECGARIGVQWNFCPACGTVIVHRFRSELAPAATVPARKMSGGLFLAAFAGPAMLMVGTIFCLTGERTFAGMALMVGGILTPLAGPAVGPASRSEKRIGFDKPSGDQIGSDGLDDDGIYDEAGGERLSADPRMTAAA